MNITEVFQYHAQKQPGLAAIIDGDRSIDFSELDDLIGRTAGHLRKLGLRPGERVGCALKENADHIVLLLGIIRAGLVYTPLDWRAPPREQDRLAARFSVTLALITEGARSPEVTSTTINGDWHGEVANAPYFAGEPTADEELAMISLSSGTTGDPSGVLQSHRAVLMQVTSRWRSFNHLGPRRYFSALPLFFSAGRLLVLDNLLNGATVVVYPNLFTAEEFVEQVKASEATVTMVVPTVMRWLLDLPVNGNYLLPDLQAVLTGAAAIHSEEKIAALERVSPQTHEVYGATGAGWISIARPEDIRLHPGSVGLPAFLVKHEVVDGDGKGLPSGETGRFRCKGPSVTGSDGTQDSWLYTGDLASQDEDGYLSLKGRSADLIIRGGANVLPEEVERVLLTHENVAEAAVVGWSSPVLGEEVAAFVVLKEDGDVDTLRNLCKDSLVPYKVPREIFVRKCFPKTASGKVVKRDLKVLLPERCEN